MYFLAERVGFEPTPRYERAIGFQDRTLQPLEYLSISKDSISSIHSDLFIRHATHGLLLILGIPPNCQVWTVSVAARVFYGVFRLSINNSRNDSAIPTLRIWYPLDYCYNVLTTRDFARLIIPGA